MSTDIPGWERENPVDLEDAAPESRKPTPPPELKKAYKVRRYPHPDKPFRCPPGYRVEYIARHACAYRIFRGDVLLARTNDPRRVRALLRVFRDPLHPDQPDEVEQGEQRKGGNVWARTPL